MNNLLEKISQHDVFNDLTKTELSELAQIMERVVFKAGDVVFKNGQVPEALFYIESGTFQVHLSNSENKTLSPGQLFGEIGVINGDFRSGTVSAADDASVISIDGNKLFDENFIDPAVALKLLRSLCKRITNLLRSKEQISTKEIIEQGENEFVEFKSTLRWNLKANKKDKAIEKAALKTLAAFMNSHGGLLIIGVADDGSILGLDNDQFPNHDKLLLNLTNLIKDRIGPLFVDFMDFSIESIGDTEVLRIDCQPATRPAYLRDDKLDHFYIRTGPATTDLRLSKVYAYIRSRFELLE